MHRISIVRWTLFVAFTLGIWGQVRVALAVDDSYELRLENFRVVADRALDDDLIELDITADLRNRGRGTWRDAVAWSELDAPGIEVVDPELRFPPIAPGATVAATDVMTLRLPGDGRAEVEATLAAGLLPFSTNGTDETIATGPIVYVDEETDLAYATVELDGDRWTYVFTRSTAFLDALRVGDVLMEEEGRHLTLMPPVALPLRVLGVQYGGGDSGEEVRVEGEETDLYETYVSGTFQVDTGFTPNGATPSLLLYVDQIDGCEDESHLPESDLGPRQTCEFRALPIRFNELELTDGVTLSGEVLLRSSGIQLEARLREGRLQRALVSLDLGTVATMELRVREDVVLDPEERTIWTLTLPTYTVSLGGFPLTLTPVVTMNVGVAAELHAGATLGLHQSSLVGVTVGWLEDRYIAEPFGFSEPVSLTPPQLADDSTATARAWVAVDVALIVEGVAGPFLRTEAFGELDVMPAADPWWEITYGLEGSAGFELSLFGVDIARWESEPWTYFEEVQPGPRRDEPDGDGGAGGLADPVDPGRVTSGEQVRWAIAVDNSNCCGQDWQRVTPLADGGAVITGRHTTAGYLLKLSSVGDVLWEWTLPRNQFPVRALELANGHFFLAGQDGNAIWVAEHDADGRRLWARAYEIEYLPSIQDVVVSEDAIGDPRFLLVCRATTGTIRERDPVVVAVDPAGEIDWGLSYTSPGADWPHSAARLSDGNIVLVGETDADVASDRSDNALVYVIEPDGDVVWATAFATLRGGKFESVCEGHDGQIYAAGTANGVINDTYPALWIGRIDPETGYGTHATVGEDYEWTHLIDDNDFFNDAPIVEGQGDTSYDVAYSITSVPTGVVLVGATGLGEGRAAWALEMTPELGVSWMTDFNGALDDVLRDVADAGDGLWVAGYSRSFVPSADQVEPDEPVGGTSTLLAGKLPYEGGLVFAPGTGGSSRYVQPRSFPSASHDAFVYDGINQAAVEFTVLPVTWTEVDAPPEPEALSSPVVRLTSFPAPPVIEVPDEPIFVRGDCNGDVSVDVADVICGLDWLFGGATVPGCVAALNTNSDSQVNIADLLYLLDFLFGGGAGPASPFPDCGVGGLDSDDDLGCATPPSC